MIEQLQREGYSRDDIIIYTNKDAATNFGFAGLSGIDVKTGVNGVETTHEDRSLWEKIKDAFSADTYEYDSSLNEEADHANNDPLYQYRDDISAEKIIITVNNYKNDPTQATENVTGRHAAGDTSTNNLHASDAARATDLDTDTDSIQLKEEQLDINKHDVTTGKVDIHKNVVDETKTVEVPVKREEIVIERKPRDGAAATTDVNDTQEDDTITIPIKEEQIEVNKRPNVSERDGANALLALNKSQFDLVQRVMADGGYTGNNFAQSVQAMINAEVIIAKQSDLRHGQVTPQRWVIERSFSWLGKYRRLWRNCERKLNTSKMMISLAFLRILLKRF
ncbi:YsnF/AvaK domain-containing protein [Lactiplantibacillus plantarum]